MAGRNMNDLYFFAMGAVAGSGWTIGIAWLVGTSVP